MRKIFLPAILAFMICSCQDARKDSGTADVKQDTTKVAAAVYQCPMDCEHGKTYDKAGVCPVCGMDLEKKG
jgi:hypothetical protein